MTGSACKGLRGLAVFDTQQGPPIVLAEDGQTYAWHLSRPVETASEWPDIKSAPGGIWFQGARLFSVRSKALKDGVLREGEVVRVGRRIGVVVGLEFPTSSRFSLRFFDFVTSTPGVARQALKAVIAGVSGTSSLILGPTGTGKECLARIIHGARTRVEQSAPFLAINLGGLSKELCTSELFGHVRGAFTGAERTKKGAFRDASNGVLFLDELGEAPKEVQASLLRALDHGEVRPVGQSEVFRSKAQVIAATNREPGTDGSIEGIRFDLIQRLAGFVIQLPSLADRPDDILPLSEYFLRRKMAESNRFIELTSGARSLLHQHKWGGNVRELWSVLNRALLINLGGVLDEVTVEDALNVWRRAPLAPNNSDLSYLDREVLRISKLTTRQRSVARRRLGIPKTTFYRRLRALNACDVGR